MRPNRHGAGIARCAALALLLTTARPRAAQDQIPPAPAKHFNDYAHVVPESTAQRLDRTLEQFERDSSCQLLVVVFPKLAADSTLEDFTVRVAQSWRAGLAGKDNGAILFVFVQDRKMRIEVGYGLEGVLTDALSKRIIEEQIAPRFRQGDYAGGLTAGVQGLMQAAKGEYRGTGRTVAGQRAKRHGVSGGVVALMFLMVAASVMGRRRGMMYHGHGRRPWGGWYAGGGGGWSGGGGGWSSGGGFRGGGGGFGGGGASGSW